MVPVIGLIGHHNSGKTTLGCRVTAHLLEMGYKVGVIKSTKEEGIAFDHPGTDTAKYGDAGAAGISLVAPDQVMTLIPPYSRDPVLLAATYFNTMDIVIVEGFKNTKNIDKIEVHRDGSEYLFNRIDNVIALVSNEGDVAGMHCFTPEQSRQVADFICRRYLEPKHHVGHITLHVDSREKEMPVQLQRLISGSLLSWLNAGYGNDAHSIEVKIDLEKKKKNI